MAAGEEWESEEAKSKRRLDTKVPATVLFVTSFNDFFGSNKRYKGVTSEHKRVAQEIVQHLKCFDNVLVLGPGSAETWSIPEQQFNVDAREVMNIFRANFPCINPDGVYGKLPKPDNWHFHPSCPTTSNNVQRLIWNALKFAKGMRVLRFAVKGDWEAQFAERLNLDNEPLVRPDRWRKGKITPSKTIPVGELETRFVPIGERLIGSAIASTPTGSPPTEAEPRTHELKSVAPTGTEAKAIGPVPIEQDITAEKSTDDVVVPEAKPVRDATTEKSAGSVSVPVALVDPEPRPEMVEVSLGTEHEDEDVTMDVVAQPILPKTPEGDHVWRFIEDDQNLAVIGRSEPSLAPRQPVNVEGDLPRGDQPEQPHEVSIIVPQQPVNVEGDLPRGDQPEQLHDDPMAEGLIASERFVILIQQSAVLIAETERVLRQGQAAPAPES